MKYKHSQYVGEGRLHHRKLATTQCHMLCCAAQEADEEPEEAGAGEADVTPAPEISLENSAQTPAGHVLEEDAEEEAPPKDELR